MLELGFIDLFVLAVMLIPIIVLRILPILVGFMLVKYKVLHH
jgi:hypothetical protein